MTGVDWRAATLRLLLGLIALLVIAGLVSLAFAGAGRPPRRAIAAGFGVVGLGIAVGGLVLLGLARGRSGRVTEATGLGALGLSVPFFAVALAV